MIRLPPCTTRPDTLFPYPPAFRSALDGGEARDGALIALIDRLGTRMGRGRFRRLVPRDTHLPEHRVLALPAVEMRAPVTWGKLTSGEPRSEEHTSELQSLMRISSAVFCLKKKT